jgi:hypothetical protein
LAGLSPDALIAVGSSLLVAVFAVWLTEFIAGPMVSPTIPTTPLLCQELANRELVQAAMPEWFEWHYTPTPGSLLDMPESELGVFGKLTATASQGQLAVHYRGRAAYPAI